jgi:large subunit ribosomal protein L10
MTREDKIAVVDELAEKLSSTDFFYIIDSSGMTVEQVNNFRRLCFTEGIEYWVVKNTLIIKALEKQKEDYSEFVNNKNVFKGFSGILFSKESGSLPAKVLQKFKEKYPKLEKPVLKGASINAGFFVGSDQLETLSKIKSKFELIGEVVGLLQSPARNVISALQSSGQKISGLLKAMEERGQ